MPIYRVSITHSAYVQASSAKVAEEFSELILDNEVEPDIDVAQVKTNELAWFPDNLIYTEDGSDLTVEEAFSAETTKESGQ